MRNLREINSYQNNLLTDSTASSLWRLIGAGRQYPWDLGVPQFALLCLPRRYRIAAMMLLNSANLRFVLMEFVTEPYGCSGFAVILLASLF